MHLKFIFANDVSKEMYPLPRMTHYFLAIGFPTNLKCRFYLIINSHKNMTPLMNSLLCSVDLLTYSCLNEICR